MGKKGSDYIKLLESVNSVLYHSDPFFIGMDESGFKEGYVIVAYYTKDRDLVRVEKFNKEKRRKSLNLNNAEKIVDYLKSLDSFRYCEFRDDGLKEDNLFSKWRVFGGLAAEIIKTYNGCYNENCFILIDGAAPTSWFKRRLSEGICYALSEYLVKKRRKKKTPLINYKEFQDHIIYVPRGDNQLEIILRADTAANGITNLDGQETNTENSFVKNKKIRPKHVGLVI